MSRSTRSQLTNQNIAFHAAHARGQVRAAKGRMGGPSPT